MCLFEEDLAIAELKFDLSKTFYHFIQKEPVVKNLIKDLQDGHVLLSLLEVLLKVKLVS